MVMLLPIFAAKVRKQQRKRKRKQTLLTPLAFFCVIYPLHAECIAVTVTAVTM